MHSLDLRPSLQELFQGFHKNRFNEKFAGPSVKASATKEDIRKFFCTNSTTAGAHPEAARLPPQPIEWFRNLITLLGDGSRSEWRPLKRAAGREYFDPPACQTLVYKYGCSDARYHHLGGMPFLMWKAIEEGKEAGIEWLDLGRSDTTNHGLNQYKDRWGTARSELAYGRISAVAPRNHKSDGHFASVAQRIFGYMPDFMLTAAGRLLYRHLA